MAVSSQGLAMSLRPVISTYHLDVVVVWLDNMQLISINLGLPLGLIP